jgi:predicted dienelactone hydrolase
LVHEPITQRVVLPMPRNLIHAIVASLCWLAACQAWAYDPLVPLFEIATPHELTSTPKGQARQIPLLVSIPDTAVPAPVILFSHGLGGSRRGCRYLHEHWATRGYVTVFLQHPGSDESVWRTAPKQQRAARLKQAASAKNMQDRVNDVAAVLQSLAAWNRQPGHLLDGRLDMNCIGMSGHSFGARTTQAVSGQIGWPSQGEPDTRIKAAVILSPSAPALRSAVHAFGAVNIPWLLMTGTEDVAPLGSQTVASRLTVFPALPAGNKYELVLAQGRHSAFTDGTSLGKNERIPHHHPAIKAISTAFWDAFLKNDNAANAWLDGTGPQAMLQPDDRWQIK